MNKLITNFILLLSILLVTGCANINDNNAEKEYFKMSAKDIYNQGIKHLKKKDYLQSIADFQALERKYPYGEYTNKAQLIEIYILYKQDKFEEAKKACGRFIRMNPRHKHVDYAYYIKAVSEYAENYKTAYKVFPIDRAKRESSKSRVAFASFKTLVLKFPKSYYSYDATQRMYALKEQIARSEFFIAKEYYKRKAFVAAANRASNLIKDFPDTCIALDALDLLEKSYTALKQHKLAKETKELIIKNHGVR